MKKAYLALALACALFIGSGIATGVRADDGDNHHASFCLQNPTAVICQSTPTPCPAGEVCPGGGGGEGRASEPDDDDDSLIDTVLSFFGF